MFRRRTNPVERTFNKIILFLGGIVVSGLIIGFMFEILNRGFDKMKEGRVPEITKDLDEIKENAERGIRFIDSPSDLALVAFAIAVLSAILYTKRKQYPRYREP